MSNIIIRQPALTNFTRYGKGRTTVDWAGGTVLPAETGDILDRHAKSKPSPSGGSHASGNDTGHTDSIMKMLGDVCEQTMQQWSRLLQRLLFRQGDTGDSSRQPDDADHIAHLEVPPPSAPAPRFTGPGNAQTIPAQPVSQPPGSINAEDFGAKGDGKTDNTHALNTVFAEAKRTGKTVYIPEGIYAHGNTLTADGIRIIGAGPGTVLRATHPAQAAIRLTGDNGAIFHLKTEVVAPTRSSMPDAAGILVQNATGATVGNVIVQGASSNGIRLDGAIHCSIANSLVTGTNAGGIALMNGSCNNKVQKCVVDQAGDDAFSDISCIGDAEQDSGNVFESCLAQNNLHGRGFALMGSADATIDGCCSVNTPSHGVAAGSAPGSGTMRGSGHTIRNSIFIGARDTPIAANGMTLKNNWTAGSPPEAGAILGFDPGPLPDRYAYNPRYRPGVANNTPGNRSRGAATG